VLDQGFRRIPLILYSTGSWLFLLLILMADEPLEPVVSTFSNAGRVSFCDSGRTPSSNDCRPVCTSGRFAKGFRIGIGRGGVKSAEDEVY
jgi:hypothetical protein